MPNPQQPQVSLDAERIATASTPGLTAMTDTMILPALTGAINGTMQNPEYLQAMQVAGIDPANQPQFEVTPELREAVNTEVQQANVRSLRKVKTHGLSSFITKPMMSVLDSPEKTGGIETLTHAVNGAFGNIFGAEITSTLWDLLAKTYEPLKAFSHMFKKAYSTVINLVITAVCNVAVPLIVEAICECFGVPAVGGAVSSAITGVVAAAAKFVLTKVVLESACDIPLDALDHVNTRIGDGLHKVVDTQHTIKDEKTQANMQRLEQAFEQTAQEGSLATENQVMEATPRSGPTGPA